MSEQRLAAAVKFNLSKENIFVSVRLIYTLRLAENEENFGWIFEICRAGRGRNLSEWKVKSFLKISGSVRTYRTTWWRIHWSLCIWGLFQSTFTNKSVKRKKLLLLHQLWIIWLMHWHKDGDGSGKNRVRLLSADPHGTVCVFNPVESCHDNLINKRTWRLKIIRKSTHPADARVKLCNRPSG